MEQVGSIAKQSNFTTKDNNEGYVVLDYDDNPLPGSWPTEQEAIDQGLCGRYLLSGFEVAHASQVHSGEVDA